MVFVILIPYKLLKGGKIQNKWEWYQNNFSYSGSVVTNTGGADRKVRIQKMCAASNSNSSSLEN